MFSLCLANELLKLPALVLFCVAAWLGLQRLGYIEFDTAGRMMMQGSFRKLLNSHISIRNFETKLSQAQTAEDCWRVLEANFLDFGFNQIEMRLAGRNYAAADARQVLVCSWRLEIPISDCDYVRLTRQFQSPTKDNVVGPFADVVRKAIEPKLTLFLQPQVNPAVEEVQGWQVASAGD
jgi:hypothetical protein